MVPSGVETGRFDRAAEALWLAAERRSVRPREQSRGKGRCMNRNTAVVDSEELYVQPAIVPFVNLLLLIASIA